MPQCCLRSFEILDFYEKAENQAPVMNHLVEIFQNTQKILWEDGQLYRRTQSAVAGTRVFPEKFDTTRVVGRFPTRISVTRETALSAVKRLGTAYGKVAVLNFANGLTPGGGVVYGGQGTEEDLCRCTNLYPCLTRPEIYGDFYLYHQRMGSSFSDRIIYSENVTVFKDDGDSPEFTGDWQTIDVMSCTAPEQECLSPKDDGRLEKLLGSRIRNILSVAEAHGVRVLVLGAFGCLGAFPNPPDIVARAFEWQINHGDFRNTFQDVIFAIAPQDDRQGYLYDVFCSILAPWQKNPLYGRNVSILGDALSTYWGANPAGYEVYYDGERCLQCGMYTQEDTWWVKVLRHFGGHLLVNNSCSAGMVCGPYRFAANSDFRTGGLHENGILPEVILVAAGMEDFYNCSPLDFPSEDPESGRDYYRFFRPSYGMMLWKLRRTYPGAEIYCQTLCAPVLSGSGEKILYNKSGISLEDYNWIIRDCASEYGCHIADVSLMKYSYETIDGCHANARGMDQLAQRWIWVLGGCSQTAADTESVSSPSALILAAAVLCCLCTAGFLALFAAGMYEQWFLSATAACVVGILPGIFAGLGILFFWMYFSQKDAGGEIEDAEYER